MHGWMRDGVGHGDVQISLGDQSKDNASWATSFRGNQETYSGKIATHLPSAPPARSPLRASCPDSGPNPPPDVRPARIQVLGCSRGYAGPAHSDQDKDRPARLCVGYGCSEREKEVQERTLVDEIMPTMRGIMTREGLLGGHVMVHMSCQRGSWE